MSLTIISQLATDIVNLRQTKRTFFADSHTECDGTITFTDLPSGEETYGSPKNTFRTPKTPNGHGRKASNSTSRLNLSINSLKDLCFWIQVNTSKSKVDTHTTETPRADRLSTLKYHRAR